ncbi:MAG TPA: NUDIX domain-containing protein [Steroidobacteraceae bacterium]
MTDKKLFGYKYPHPAVAVDLAIFTLQESRLQVLLIERARDPFKGRWALPGGFVRIHEDLDAAAARELEEETGVAGAYLEQVGAFGAPQRDPRERVISVAFFAIIPSDTIHLKSGGDAAAARWWPVSELPKVAFDHAEILEQARHRLRDKIRRSTIALRFLPPEFTLTELQQVHEAILGQELDKRNFRKWLTSLPYLRATGRMRRGGQHRPAELYRAIAAALIKGTGPTIGDDYSSTDESSIAQAYQRGYQDAAREFAAAMDSTQRDLMRRVRPA